MKHAMHANLILVGPMGAGKTAIGKPLAALGGWRFVDADRLLEERLGVSIADIFAMEGEAGFRQRESALLSELLAESGQLIATGGGVILAEENRRLIKKSGIVVHLALSVAGQLQRLQQDRSRPLLQCPDRAERLQAMAQLRTPLYDEVADLRFSSEGLSVDAASRRLHGLLRCHFSHCLQEP